MHMFPQTGKAIMCLEEVWYMVKTSCWFFQLGKLIGRKITGHMGDSSKMAPKAAIQGATKIQRPHRLSQISQSLAVWEMHGLHYSCGKSKV